MLCWDQLNRRISSVILAYYTANPSNTSLTHFSKRVCSLKNESRASFIHQWAKSEREWWRFLILSLKMKRCFSVKVLVTEALWFLSFILSCIYQMEEILDYLIPWEAALSLLKKERSHLRRGWWATEHIWGLWGSYRSQDLWSWKLFWHLDFNSHLHCKSYS